MITKTLSLRWMQKNSFLYGRKSPTATHQSCFMGIQKNGRRTTSFIMQSLGSLPVKKTPSLSPVSGATLTPTSSPYIEDSSWYSRSSSGKEKSNSTTSAFQMELHALSGSWPTAQRHSRWSAAKKKPRCLNAVRGFQKDRLSRLLSCCRLTESTAILHLGTHAYEPGAPGSRAPQTGALSRREEQPIHWLLCNDVRPERHTIGRPS